jgi:pyruvate/2-oxoglutarate dehydrogenase complex dihydrolipoamide acyltransferase (E2) component
VSSSRTDTLVEVLMPQMGVSVAEGTLTEWRKQPGDWIKADETIADVTTDKVDVEIPSPASGRVAELLIEPDTTVSVGTPMATIDSAAQPGEAHPDESHANGSAEGATVTGDASAASGPLPESGSAEASPAPAPPADEATEEAGPATPQAKAADPIDLDRVRELWPSVVGQLRDSGSELLSTLFDAARPVAVDVEEAVLKVGFPASAAFNKRKAEAAEARDRFAEAVRTTVGERLRPVFVLLEGEDEADAAAEEALSPEELIERFKSEFDAEEVEITDNREESDAREAAG